MGWTLAWSYLIEFWARIKLLSFSFSTSFSLTCYCSAEVHVLSRYKVSERLFLSFELRGSVGNAFSLFVGSAGFSVDFANLCSCTLLYPGCMYLNHVHLRAIVSGLRAKCFDVSISTYAHVSLCLMGRAVEHLQFCAAQRADKVQGLSLDSCWVKSILSHLIKP